MLSEPTFAAALVSGLRAHGHRPSGPDGRHWALAADDARTLALGLVAAGVEPGSAVRVVAEVGDSPDAVLAAELAVLASGAVLVVDDTAEADAELSSAGLTGAGKPRSLGEVSAAGAEVDRGQPSAHEDRLAAIAPDDVAVRGDGVAVTQAQALWALRCVAAWIGPVADGPRSVLGVPPSRGTLTAALLGRWWPATAGAALAAPRPAGPVHRSVDLRPDVVIGDAEAWDELVDAVRASAAGSRAGTTLLRRGRALIAGEVAGRAERVGRSLAERRAGERLRGAAGLDRLALGICLGPLPVATGRDLAAVGLPVIATWVEPGVPAPVASGPRARPTPAEPWGRPLPGRSIDPGPPAVVHGGDLDPAGHTTTAPVEVDARDRVRLPAPTGGPS